MRVSLFLLLLFPLIELALLIKVGSIIGVGWTLFLIIATLFAFSHLSFSYDVDELANGFARLYAYATDHLEAREIFRAID